MESKEEAKRLGKGGGRGVRRAGGMGGVSRSINGSLFSNPISGPLGQQR